MAVFEYRCQDCNANYDILHLGKEKQEDIICPHCNSPHYKKLLSVFNSSSNSSPAAESTQMPACAGGACGIDGGCFN